MMRSLFHIILLTALFLSVVSCKESAPKQAIETPEVSFEKEGELTIFQAATDSVLVKMDIEIAESDYETQTGLMYRSGMEENQAMLFVFDYVGWHSFYMKNTEFALDILFIDEDLKVASFKDNAQPMDESGISSEAPVQYVLEVNAGLREKWGVSVGDSIAYTRN